MASINTAILAGNIGQDPEPVGEGGARFSLATTFRKRVSDDEYEDVTEWHTIVCWNATARFVLEYAKKGQACTVQGSISYFKNDEGRVYTSIRARDVVLPKQGGGAAPKAKREKIDNPATSDDIPWE